MNERYQTHWTGCWRDRHHHACAAGFLEQMIAAIDEHLWPERKCRWCYDSEGGRCSLHAALAVVVEPKEEGE